MKQPHPSLLTLILLILAGTVALTNPAREVLAAEDPAPQTIHVYPAEIKLTTKRDRQSFIVQAMYANGITHDVTDQAKISIGNEAIIRREGNVLYPLADGSTSMIVRVAGQSIPVPIDVHQATAERDISFRLDVMPVLTKTGCNTGGCHGAASGQDGFELSLFGYNPAEDYHRLTREISGRRLNLASPHESLLIQKSIGKVPHTGGQLFDEKSEYYAAMIRWLEAGAPDDGENVPRVTSIEFYPRRAVLDGKGCTQQLTVRASYSDGTNRDVTSLAKLATNNDQAVTIADDGTVTAQGRGEAFLTAHFETHTVGTHFNVLPKSLDFTWSNAPEFNYIDRPVHEKLQRLRINPSELCDDGQFLRRATIDLTGQLPTVEEYRQFIADKDTSKRGRLVDDLIGRSEFNDVWTMKWADVLQMRTGAKISKKALNSYHAWLKTKIADNAPLDEMTRELIAASGGTLVNAETNYYQSEEDILKVSENVAQVFLGMRLQCAQCHNHPFDRWTQNDYYGFAAFFAQVGRKPAEDPRETIIFNQREGETKHPVGKKVVQPKFLGGDVPELADEDRRVVLARWMTSKENPYFARHMANMIWDHFFHRGIVDDPDDVRVSNPPINPELLDALAEKLVSYDFDFKRLVRDICNSRTYQLSTRINETNETDTDNFSRAVMRRIRAAVLLDCISQITGTGDKFTDVPKGTRAVQIANGATTNYFLFTFGRSSRETACSCDVKMEPNLSQALHLINGNATHHKVARGQVVYKMIKAGKSPPEIIEELYIRCFSRLPTEKESKTLLSLIEEEPNMTKALRDVFWSLLNSREFVFNH